MLLRPMRGAMYAIGALTLPLSWLLMRWGQSWNVPFHTFYQQNPPPEAGFIFIPAAIGLLLGLLCMAVGLTGLFGDAVRFDLPSVPTSYVLTCAGIVGTGPMLGVVFLSQGLNPISWLGSPWVFLPLILLAIFGLASFRMWDFIVDPHGFRDVRTYGHRRIRRNGNHPLH